MSTGPDLTEGYRGPQVCKIVGITYRQLDHWTRTDLVRPSLAQAHGSGTQRLYSYTDLVELKVIKSLLDGGLSLQSVRKVIDYLRDNLGTDVASANLVIDGSRSVLARTGEELIDLVRRGQGVLNIVPLGSVKQELDASIVEFGPLTPEAPFVSDYVVGRGQRTSGRAPRATGT
jgi:DNA-binding transcriptional MerR regulator